MALLLECVLVLWAGIIFAIGVFFGASFLYFISMHRAGTADYAAKTVAIGLLTIPVAILLSLAPIIYGVTVAVRRVVQVIGAAWRWIVKSKPTEELGGDDPADTAEVTVHLVHGTFEPRAPWTLPGSEMRKAIEGIKHTVKIARFSWSGHNSPVARSRAAQALAKKLEASPSNRHYIVAHSHGGAIVREMSHLYPEIASKIHGVCLLSTPFIFRKEIDRTAGNLIRLNSIGFIFATQIPIAAATLLLGFGPYLPYAAVIGSIIAFIVEFVLSKYCRSSYAKEMNVEQEKVDFRDVQIYHAIGDEADSGLRFVSFLHEACFGVLSQLKAAARLAKGKFHWPFVASYVFFIGAIGYVTLAPAISKVWMAVNSVGLGVILVAHLVQKARPSKDESQVLVAAALPIVTFSFWLAAAKAMAYGDWRLIFCPEIFVSSSETPTGDHRVLKFAPQSDGTMVHSTHSHPEAVRNVAAWLDSSLDEKRAKGARDDESHATVH
ncbi:hypothetical protein [Burkholderia ubonensis]|uniref:hypothetical protein n=1 Tax=Burkholderia ubonensis TaxID=101571 RepID=UPI000AB1A19D|nr:hypothetical protein [Burkholderia ubonensis]